MSFGEAVVARGAALLFATNVVAIVLGAAINFYAAGIRGSGKSTTQSKPLWVRRAVLGLVSLCALLTIPLGSAILSAMVEKKNQLLRRQLPQGLRPAVAAILNPDLSAELEEEAGLNRITLDSLRRGDDADGNAILELEISAPESPSQDQLDAIAQAARDFFKSPVVIRLRTVLVQEAVAK